MSVLSAQVVNEHYASYNLDRNTFRGDMFIQPAQSFIKHVVGNHPPQEVPGASVPPGEAERVPAS